MTLGTKLNVCWQDCFVLLNVAQYLNGEDIYALRSTVTLLHQASLNQKFDDVVKHMAFHRLDAFDRKKNETLLQMAIYFIRQHNKAKHIMEWPHYYWIYDMIGAKEPALDLIHPSMYSDMRGTDWRRDDHRTFLTTEIFLSGNIFLIINILQFIQINSYSLTCRYGSSVNQIDKILLKLVLSFGKSLKSTLSSDELPQFTTFHTKFLEFAYFYLHQYVPYIRHPQFLHKVLNRAIHCGDMECVEMLRKKCRAPILMHTDTNILFEGEQKLFETFRTAQYCINIWSLMVLHLHFDHNLLLSLRVCYDMNSNQIEPHELLDMEKLQVIRTYCMKPTLCDQNMKYDKNKQVLSFFRFLKQRQHLFKDQECIVFVDKEIELHALQ